MEDNDHVVLCSFQLSSLTFFGFLTALGQHVTQKGYRRPIVARLSRRSIPGAYCLRSHAAISSGHIRGVFRIGRRVLHEQATENTRSGRL